MKGPRIIFKDDRDSNIGRGAVLYAGHFRPEVAVIVRIAAEEAPSLIDDTLIVSEGWRHIRETRDLHHEGRAFDLSCNQIEGDEGERHAIAVRWADRIRARLGPGYDVIVHGEGRNLHIHIELDP